MEPRVILGDLSHTKPCLISSCTGWVDGSDQLAATKLQLEGEHGSAGRMARGVQSLRTAVGMMIQGMFIGIGVAMGLVIGLGLN